MIDESITRRGVFIAGGAAVLGLSAITRANAATMSREESANAKTVRDFFDRWQESASDAMSLASFLAEDCVLRLDEKKPAANGRAEAIKAFQPYLAGGQRYDMKTVEVFAKGPLVATTHDDAVKKDGKIGGYTPVLSVFIFKDGKIKEWADYVLPKSP